MAFEHIFLIVNPASGQPEPVLHHVNQVFHDAGVDWQVSVTTAKRDGTALTKAALEAGADLIAVYGGDGTVKSVINGLIDSDVPLAILQGGTGNAMAQELGIPVNLQQAVRLIVDGHRLREVDVGKIVCDDDPDKFGHFILRTSMGLQNQLLEEATSELKRQFGNLAYIMAGLRTFSQREIITFKLTIDGKQVEASGLTCIVANSASTGGDVNFVFAPDVQPDDGELDVFVVDSGLESLVSMINSSIGANLDEYPNHWRGKEVRVEIEKPSVVTIDGEPFGETPIDVTVMPKAVKVLVPEKQPNA